MVTIVSELYITTEPYYPINGWQERLYYFSLSLNMAAETTHQQLNIKFNKTL